MPKKNDRSADDRALNRNSKKPKDDRILGLGKLIGRKPPKEKT